MGLRPGDVLNERTVGALLCSLSAAFMLFYTWLLFLPPQDWTVLGKPLTWWAVALPVYVLVFIFFGILIWIGWAMATTPEQPPLRAEPPQPPERDRDEPTGRPSA